MSDDFVENLGLPFLAHRLRRVSESILQGAGEVFRRHGIALPPRGGSLVMLLQASGQVPITVAAKRLRLSHPLIITLSKTLGDEGFVLVEDDPEDRRRRLLSLTKKGRDLAQSLQHVNSALSQTYRDIFQEAGIDLFAAVEAFEGALHARSFEQRLLEHFAGGHGTGRKKR